MLIDVACVRYSFDVQFLGYGSATTTICQSDLVLEETVNVDTSLQNMAVNDRARKERFLVYESRLSESRR